MEQLSLLFVNKTGGESGQWQQVGEAVLSACESNPYCLAAQQLSYWTRQLGLKVIDSDDYIGSFSIDFGFNNDGSFWWKRGNLERYCSEEKWGDQGIKIQLCGDGSDYSGWFYFGNGQ